MKKTIKLTHIILSFAGLCMVNCQNHSPIDTQDTEKIAWSSERELLYETDRINGTSWMDIEGKFVCIDDYSDDSFHSATLPYASVCGTTIQMPSGILYVGGRDSSECHKDVYKIVPSDKDFHVISEKYPSLPQPISEASGTMLGNKVYVIGGETNHYLRELTNTVFALDISNELKGWELRPSLPGHVRKNAICIVQNNGVSPCIYVIGGESSTPQDSCRILTDGYVYNPQLNKWDSLSTSFPSHIHAAIACGANHILLFQHVKKETSETDFYRLWRYHTITGTLIPYSEVPCPGQIAFAKSDGTSLSIIYKHEHSSNASFYLLQGKIMPIEKRLGIINVIVIIGYFTILSGIGVYFSRRQKNTNDYFKGGGRIPWWAAGLSLFGTALSAITFMAIPSKAYASNWSYMLFNVGIVFVAPIIVYLFIPYFRKQNLTTAYEYLEIRFCSLIRTICSLTFILFQIGRMGIVLFLPSIALNVVTGVNIFICIFIMGICSIIYTMIGGIEAVVWTDAIQVIILLGGAIFAVMYITQSLPNGFNDVFTIATDNGKFDMGSMHFNLNDTTMWTVIIAAFFTHLTTYGTDQSMVQRYLTTTSIQAARKSVWTNALLTIPATLLFFFIGTALYAYYKVYPEELSISIPNGDAIFPWYIFTRLPVGITGLLISGIFAAAMSTLSGSMNSAATAFMIDIFPYFQRRKPHQNGLKVARISTCIAGLISLLFAVMMATWNIASLWDEFNKILGLVLGSLGGLFMLGMMTKRANSAGALIGMIASVLTQLYITHFTHVHLLLYTASGFISCFVIGYLASLPFEDNKNS